MMPEKLSGGELRVSSPWKCSVPVESGNALPPVQTTEDKLKEQNLLQSMKRKESSAFQRNRLLTNRELDPAWE